MESNLNVKFIVSEDLEGQSIGNNMSRNIIINPILVMRSQFIPSSLSIGISIIVNGIDFRRNHEVQIKLFNVELDRTIYDTGVTTINASSDSQTIDNFSFNLQLRNIPFESEGAYKVIFIFDNEEYSDEFKVLKVGS